MRPNSQQPYGVAPLTSQLQFEGPIINAIAAKKKCDRGDVVEAIVRAVSSHGLGWWQVPAAGPWWAARLCFCSPSADTFAPSLHAQGGPKSSGTKAESVGASVRDEACSLLLHPATPVDTVPPSLRCASLMTKAPSPVCMRMVRLRDPCACMRMPYKPFPAITLASLASPHRGLCSTRTLRRRALHRGWP